MNTDIEIVQDLFNALAISGPLQFPVYIQDFVAGAQGLRELGPDPTSDPRHVMQCIDKMRQGIGSEYFRHLFDTPADVDDLWVHYFCPQPPGTDLHKAECPAGTHPLWTNGKATVFVRPTKDKHGNSVFDFGIC